MRKQSGPEPLRIRRGQRQVQWIRVEQEFVECNRLEGKVHCGRRNGSSKESRTPGRGRQTAIDHKPIDWDSSVCRSCWEADGCQRDPESGECSQSSVPCCSGAFILALARDVWGYPLGDASELDAARWRSLQVGRWPLPSLTTLLPPNQLGRLSNSWEVKIYCHLDQPGVVHPIFPAEGYLGVPNRTSKIRTVTVIAVPDPKPLRTWGKASGLVLPEVVTLCLDCTTSGSLDWVLLPAKEFTAPWKPACQGQFLWQLVFYVIWTHSSLFPADWSGIVQTQVHHSVRFKVHQPWKRAPILTLLAHKTQTKETLDRHKNYYSQCLLFKKRRKKTQIL